MYIVDEPLNFKFPNMSKYMSEVCAYHIMQDSIELEYVDSWRASKVSSVEGMGAFNKARTCCGEAEFYMEFYGELYIMGYNYGH